MSQSCQVGGETWLPWIFCLGIAEAIRGDQHGEEGRNGELDYSDPEGGDRVGLAEARGTPAVQAAVLGYRTQGLAIRPHRDDVPVADLRENRVVGGESSDQQRRAVGDLRR